MSRIALAAIAVILSHSALAQDSDPCTRFTWNVTHELAVMRQEPQKILAAAKRGSDVPKLQLDKVYELKLANQGTVKYALTPGKPTLPDNAQGGIAHFKPIRPGDIAWPLRAAIGSM
jgi:hypothetical protein